MLFVVADAAAAVVVVTCPGEVMVTLGMRDLQNVLSSITLHSFCKLETVASFRESVHLVLGLLFLQPSTFPALFLFQRILPSLYVLRVGQTQLQHFCLQR